MKAQREVQVGDLLVRGLVIGSAAIAISIFIYMMMFCGPSADDYCRGRIKGSFVNNIINTYIKWSGRWCAHSLEYAILPNVNLLRVYPLMQEGLCLLQALGFYSLWRTLLGEDAKRKSVGMFAIVTLAVLWGGMPGVNETLFWFTGFIEYQLPIALSLIMIAGLISLEHAQKSNFQTFVYTAGLAVLAFLITGMHELCALSLTIILGAGVIVSYLYAGRAKKAWVIVFLMASLGLAITTLAPGNTERAADIRKNMGNFPTDLNDRINVGGKVFFTVFMNTLPDWLLDIKLLAAIALLVLEPHIKMRSGLLFQEKSRLVRWIALNVWLMLVLGWIAGPCWIFCDYFPPRILSSAYSLFVIGLIINVALWIRRDDPESVAYRSRVGMLLRTGAMLVLSLSLVLEGNAKIALHDIFHGRPKSYQRTMYDRERTIFRALAAGQQDVLLDPISVRPRLFFQSDIKTEEFKHHPTFFHNICMANYYNLRSVLLRRTEAAPPH